VETGRLGGETPVPGEGGVPAPLYDPLMVRLDRLGDGKRVAQLAAALGRRFRADILLAVAEGEGRPDVGTALERLVALGLIQRVREDAPLFAFKHALLRDVAYESLLRRDRRAIHGAIAHAIEARFPDLAEAEPDYLAQHFSQARQCGAAFRRWVQAARQSVARSANIEAISQLRSALAELEGIPAGRERDAMELEAQTTLLGPVMAALGYGDPEFAATGRRAFELCRTLDCGPQVFPVLYSLWSHNRVTGELQEAYRIAHEFLQMAERQDQPGARVVGHRLCGSSLLSIGAPVEARPQLERAIALYEPARDRALAFSYGSDVRAVSLCHLAIACWLLGDQERAATHCAEALAEAQALGHANTLGYTVGYACMLHVLERDGRRVENLASRMLSVAKERELPFWESVAEGFLGWSALQAGRMEEGITALERTLTFARAANTVQWLPNCLGWLAEAYGALGDTTKAHAHLEEAAVLMQRGGEAWWEPERRRVMGELLLREGRTDAARTWLEEAVEAARSRGEKSLELRAVLALARHLAASGRPGEARTRLAAAMAPFEGAWAGVDQREARALLEAIAAAPKREHGSRGSARAVRQRTHRTRKPRQTGPVEDPEGAG
jgi:predicted ATPase